MRYILPFMLMAIFYTACKKDFSACKDKEITGREKAADISAITSKELLDTLAKYPQLVPYMVQNSDYASQLFCHVYYKDLLIFSDDYDLYKQYSVYAPMHDTLTSFGRILNSDPGISLAPTISAKAAVKEAKKYINFDHTCIAYQLGLYDINVWDKSKPVTYRLAWKIMDAQNAYSYVIMDATNNQALLTDDGRRWFY